MLEIRAWEGQENFRLILQSDIDFDTYSPSAQVIEYEDPDGTVDTWTATVLTGSETEGKIYHDFAASPDEVPAAGRYKVRQKLTIASKIVYTKKQVWIVGEF